MTAKLEARRPMPEPAFLRTILEYRDGLLFWKERPAEHFATPRIAAVWNGMCAGKRAGSKKGNGYRDVTIDKVRLLEHRVVFVMMTGDDIGGLLIDHIDGNKANNRIENLRLCTSKENGLNRGGYKLRQLPKNVFFHHREGKYKVGMRVHGRRMHFGTFANLEEASAVAKAMRSMYHGDFAHD